jgi:putative nucleotidyltransferase with HDIG domain
VDYLMKPFSRDRLREAVWRGIEWHSAAFESRRLKEALERDVQVRQTRLADAISTLGLDSDESLDAILAVLTFSCHDTYTHACRVAALAVRTARELELPAADVATIERAALLHDFGKLAMPESILRKPAPLSTPEQQLIRKHPTVGYQLIAHLPYLEDAAIIVRDAQERVDGLGYPRGIRGEEISIGARIVSVADAYDTMTRPRSYREAISPAEAIVELENCAGTQFDARVVESFCRIVGTQ